MGQASELASIWALRKVFQLNWRLDSPAARRNNLKHGGLGYNKSFEPIRDWEYYIALSGRGGEGGDGPQGAALGCVRLALWAGK